MDSKIKVQRQDSQILQVVIIACVILAVMPTQADMNSDQIMEMLAKLDKEQRKMRSKIEEIEKITAKRNLEEQDLEQIRASRTKRTVQANSTKRSVLVTILRELSLLKTRVNRRPTVAVVPYLRGPPGHRGKKGDKGEKGEKGDSGSTTFIRWGKLTCPNTQGTTKIYSGRIGGQHFTHTGGTSSQLCLHMNPRFVSNAGDTLQWIYGTEYEIIHGNPFTKSIHDHEAVCVVCLVNSRGSKLVVNGRNDCPTGWTLEYHGYLMSAHYGHKGRTQAICVDVDADVAPGTHQNLNGNLLYTIQAGCGSLPCAPYINGREITCAVCTK